MNFLLVEVFGVNEPDYMMGIAFETVGYDQEQNATTKRRGWEVPYLVSGISDVSAYASKYQIPTRLKSDGRKFWESEDSFQDGMTGDETYYSLFVKNVDGSDISEKQFSEINASLSGDDDSQGVGVTPRPLVMSH